MTEGHLNLKLRPTPATVEQVKQFQELMGPVFEAARLVLPKVWAWQNMDRTAGAHPDKIEEHVTIYNKYYKHEHMHGDEITSYGVRFQLPYNRQCSVPWWVLLNPDTWEATKRERWFKRAEEIAARVAERKDIELANARRELEKLLLKHPELATEVAAPDGQA